MQEQGSWPDRRAGGACSSGQGLGPEGGQVPGGGWGWAKLAGCLGGSKGVRLYCWILKMESDLRMQGPASHQSLSDDSLGLPPGGLLGSGPG